MAKLVVGKQNPSNKIIRIMAQLADRKQPPNISEFKTTLLNRRQKVLHEMNILRRKILAEKKAEIETIRFHNNSRGSQGKYLSKRKIYTMLLIEANEYLQKLEAALRRIEKGIYGFCLKTGKRIPTEQLKAIPHRKYCEEVRYKFVMNNNEFQLNR